MDFKVALFSLGKNWERWMTTDDNESTKIFGEKIAKEQQANKLFFHKIRTNKLMVGGNKRRQRPKKKTFQKPLRCGRPLDHQSPGVGDRLLKLKKLLVPYFWLKLM